MGAGATRPLVAGTGRAVVGILLQTVAMALSSHTTAGAGQLGTLLRSQPEGDLAAWLFAVLSLLYRGEVGADPAPAAAEVSTEQARASAAAERPSAEVLTKRAQAERAYAELSADGAPVSAGQLAAAAGLSASYARALVAQFQAQPLVVLHGNGHPTSRPASVEADQDAAP